MRWADVSAPEEYPTEMTLLHDAFIAGRVALLNELYDLVYVISTKYYALELYE